MRTRLGLVKVCLLAVLLGVVFSHPGRTAGGEAGGPAIRPGLTAMMEDRAVGPLPRIIPPKFFEAPTASLNTEPDYHPLESLLKFLVGGYLASRLWTFMFRYPASPSWWEESWPLGLLDFLALVALVYLGYRVLSPAFREEEAPTSFPDHAFLKPQVIAPVELTVQEQAVPGMEQICASDADFNMEAFGEYARRAIADFYTAWNRQDLGMLKKMVTEEMFDFLSMALNILKMRGEISRLEDLLLKSMVVTGAGQDDKGDFITIWLEGRVLDYILQRHSYKLLAGSLTYHAELYEYWHFERRPGQGNWQIVNIEDY